LRFSASFWRFSAKAIESKVHKFQQVACCGGFVLTKFRFRAPTAWHRRRFFLLGTPALPHRKRADEQAWRRPAVIRAGVVMVLSIASERMAADAGLTQHPDEPSYPQGVQAA
jgi:hypothetical protein